MPIAKATASIVAACLLSACASQPAGNQASGSGLAELSAAYRAASTGEVKRDVCIAAIDQGIIRVGADLSVVRLLCGADFRERADDGIVDFDPPLPNSTDKHGRASAGGFVGWYMVVKHQDGQILGYNLTNTHK